MTIRAWAVKDGCVDSVVVTATFKQAAPPPIRADKAGGSIIGSGSQINISCSDPNLRNAVIRYTCGINGADPNTLPNRNSEIAWVSATGGGGVPSPITIKEDTIIWVQLFNSLTGDPIGDIAEFRYDVVTANPTANHSSKWLTLDDLIELSSITDDAEIYYTITTDGTEPVNPDRSSIKYLSPILVQGEIDDIMSIKAKAYSERLPGKDSSIVSFTYTIKKRVDEPTATRDSGEIKHGTEIALVCNTTGATIHYTTDGKEPTQNSAVYSTPIKVYYPQTIKMRAFKDDMVSSKTAERSYVISPEEITLHIEGLTAQLPSYVADSKYVNGTYTVGVMNIPATVLIGEDRKAIAVFAVGGGAKQYDFAKSIISDMKKTGDAIGDLGDALSLPYDVIDVLELFKLIN